MDFLLSAIDGSVSKNWLEAVWQSQIIDVLLDPGSIPASYVDSEWAAKMGLEFVQLPKPKRVRYPSGEIIHSFYFVEIDNILIKRKSVINDDVLTSKLKFYCLEGISPQMILGSRHIYELDLYGELPKLEELRQQLAKEENLSDLEVETPSLAAMDQREAPKRADVEGIVEEFNHMFSEDLPSEAALLEPIKIELIDSLPQGWPPKALQGAPRRQPHEYWKEIVRQTTLLEEAKIIERSTAEL